MEIEVLLKQGMGVREVARRCGVSRNTVRRVRAEGSGRRYQRAPRASKLDDFREYIGERLAAASPAWIPATVMLREIRERGYTGSHSILRVLHLKSESKQRGFPHCIDCSRRQGGEVNAERRRIRENE